jgi:hypothetical protein
MAASLTCGSSRRAAWAQVALSSGGVCTTWYMRRLFETSRHIAVPMRQMWEVPFDVARWPEWTPTVDSVERLDAGPFGVGACQGAAAQAASGRCGRSPRASTAGSFMWEAKGPRMKTIARHEVVTDGAGSMVTLSLEQTGPMGPVAGACGAS